MEQGRANSLTRAGPGSGFGSWVAPGRQQLWFLTSAGPSIGFGHLRRCTVLAGLLEPRYEPSLVSCDGDVWTPEWAGRRGWQSLTLGPHLTASEAELPAGVVIDTRREESAKRALSEFSRRGVPSLSIHDLGLGLLPSSVVIDGSIDPARPSEVSAGSKYLCGTEFMVLDPSFAPARRVCGEDPGPVTRVFVGLGGGCRRDFLETVLGGIGVWRRDVEVVVLPGFAGLEREEVLKRFVPLANLRWASPNGSVAEALAGCGLAVTAGGVTAYEALAVGTPLVALSYDQHQARALREMERRGLCANLGRGEDLAPAAVAEALARLDANPEMRRQMSLRGLLLVDGLGAERVASEVCEMACGALRSRMVEVEVVEGAPVRP